MSIHTYNYIEHIQSLAQCRSCSCIHSADIQNYKTDWIKTKRNRGKGKIELKNDIHSAVTWTKGTFYWTAVLFIIEWLVWMKLHAKCSIVSLSSMHIDQYRHRMWFSPINWLNQNAILIFEYMIIDAHHCTNKRTFQREKNETRISNAKNSLDE